MTTGNAHLYRHPDFHRLFSLERIGIGNPQPSDWVHENRRGIFRYLTGHQALVVSIDGACTNTRKTMGKGRLWRLLCLEYNVSNPLKEHHPQTSQRAELKGIESLIELACWVGDRMRCVCIDSIKTCYISNYIPTCINGAQANGLCFILNRVLSLRLRTALCKPSADL